MKKNIFNVVSSEIKGRHLIEASAGTGKTYLAVAMAVTAPAVLAPGAFFRGFRWSGPPCPRGDTRRTAAFGGRAATLPGRCSTASPGAGPRQRPFGRPGRRPGAPLPPGPGPAVPGGSSRSRSLARIAWPPAGLRQEVSRRGPEADPTGSAPSGPEIYSARCHIHAHSQTVNTSERTAQTPHQPVDNVVGSLLLYTAHYPSNKSEVRLLRRR